MKYLEEALDFYLGGNSVSKEETVSLEKPSMIVKESPVETLQNSKPELKLWR